MLIYAKTVRAPKWGIVFGLRKLGGLQPKIMKFQSPCPLLEMFTRICQGNDYAYILESLEGPEKLAEYSFMGFDPKIVITVKNRKAEIQDKIAHETLKLPVDDPLNLIKMLTGETCTHTKFRFIGGAVGYVSYDAVRYWERLPEIASDDLAFPDLEMGFYDDGIIFDHRRREAFYYYYRENRLDELLKLLHEAYMPEPLSYYNPETNMKKEDFEGLVEKAKGYIASGDIFQVVLSKRYKLNFHGSLIRFYRALRRINPSPYMYYLKMGQHQVVGSSPEMLMRVEGGVVETYPIAGTRPRVDDPAINEALKQELLSDPKERAEHVMLVDLARNDVGKVAEFGTVSVPEFMQIYEYSHVQHIVSRVIGKLRKNCSCYDALRALFPAGTVSGAPKVRAMEIIEESEPTRRGPYAGAVGYFSYNGNADFAIAIRTLAAYGNEAYLQAGAGIVADSVPEREWLETEHKASALFRALKSASEEDVA